MYQMATISYHTLHGTQHVVLTEAELTGDDGLATEFDCNGETVAIPTPFPADGVTCDFAVDISSTLPIKRRMLALHASQRDWLMHQHGMDKYLMAMETWSAERGKGIGCDYAEGFIQHLGHPYPHDNLLLDLLR